MGVGKSSTLAAPRDVASAWRCRLESVRRGPGITVRASGTAA